MQNLGDYKSVDKANLQSNICILSFSYKRLIKSGIITKE